MNEEHAIRSKAIALVERTILVLEQLDRGEFPTETSEKAREVLLKILGALLSPAIINQVDPALLLQKAIHLRKIVNLLEHSTTTHISWPLVGYCDRIWKQFFPTDEKAIFYSLTQEHNYLISRFSENLRENVLPGIFPPSMINDILQGSDLYCLQLASIEDQNLPLYALIGHEFGHAVLDTKNSDLLAIFSKHFGAVLKEISNNLYSIEPMEAERRKQRSYAVLFILAKELFADMLGTLLMGPAFVLSLYEMSWGSDRSICSITLLPSNEGGKAYPSYNFRFSCLLALPELIEFFKVAKEQFKKLPTTRLKEIISQIENINGNSHPDRIKVRGHAGMDAVDSHFIEKALSSCWETIQGALNNYLKECNSNIKSWYSDSIKQINPQDIAELLLRLEHNILPNIVPAPGSDELLGRPADFTSILNAAALYRLQKIAETESDNYKEIGNKVGIVERFDWQGP